MASKASKYVKDTNHQAIVDEAIAWSFDYENQKIGAETKEEFADRMVFEKLVQPVCDNYLKNQAESAALSNVTYEKVEKA